MNAVEAIFDDGALVTIDPTIIYTVVSNSWILLEPVYLQQRRTDGSTDSTICRNTMSAYIIDRDTIHSPHTKLGVSFKMIDTGFDDD